MDRQDDHLMLRYLAICILWLGGIHCGPGSGETLDERGRPFDQPFAPGLSSRYGATLFEPEYESIALYFFEPFCADCHGGGAPSTGLDMTFERGFQEMVGVSSLQSVDLNLIEPGDANNSYLIIKLEGGDEMVGRQMPRGRPARPQGEIDIVRQWIDDGARRN